MGVVGFIFVALLASIHGAVGDCSYQNFLGDDDYLVCVDDCCGTYYSRYCCSDSIDSTVWPSSFNSFSAGISTAAIAGIVIGVIIFIATIVGIILCVVCCAKAASQSPPTRGVVMTNPVGPAAVVSTQATTNQAFVQPQPQAAYQPPPPYGYPTTQGKF